MAEVGPDLEHTLKEGLVGRTRLDHLIAYLAYLALASKLCILINAFDVKSTVQLLLKLLEQQHPGLHVAR